MSGKEIGVTRFRLYPVSGGRIYIPQSLLRSPEFPFLDGDRVKIEIKDGKLIVSRAED